MTKQENDRLKAIYKRRDWLRTRIYQTSADKTELSYDRQEESALDWGIKIIEKYLGVSDEPTCNHYWAKWSENEVFCTRCLEIKKI